LKRYVLDAGPFLLIFTKERGSDKIQSLILKHEKGEVEVYMHPNNLVEAYTVLNRIIKEKPYLLKRRVNPATIIKSAYATLFILNDEETTLSLAKLKAKYRKKPWGDLSAAALALRLSEEKETPVIVLDNEKHFHDIEEVKTLKVSELTI